MQIAADLFLFLNDLELKPAEFAPLFAVFGPAVITSMKSSLVRVLLSSNAGTFGMLTKVVFDLESPALSTVTVLYVPCCIRFSHDDVVCSGR